LEAIGGHGTPILRVQLAGQYRQLGHVIEQGYVLDGEPAAGTPRGRSSEAPLPCMDLGSFAVQQCDRRSVPRASQGPGGSIARRSCEYDDPPFCQVAPKKTIERAD